MAMWRNIALPSTALLLSCALQGCLFSKLPPAVQIGIARECEAKAQDLPGEEVLKLVPGLKGCEDLDDAKLKAFGVDCENYGRGFLDAVMIMECEGVVASKVKGTCGNPVPDGCKEAVTSSVNEWKPTPLQEPPKDSQEAEVVGPEGALGVVGECHREVEKNAARFDKIKKVCATGTNKDNMEKMGLDASHCEEFVVSMATRADKIFCIMSVLTSPDAPEKEEDLTMAWIKGKVADYMKVSLDLTKDEDALETQRLFQTVMTGKKWVGSAKQLSSSMIAIYGAVLMVALFSLVAVGWRKRNTQQAMQQDEMLMVSE